MKKEWKHSPEKAGLNPLYPATNSITTTPGQLGVPGALRSSPVGGTVAATTQGGQTREGRGLVRYREANKKRHVPLKVALMCSKVHGFSHPGN